MRTLSSTLLSAQQSASGIPYVKVEAKNKIAGVVRLDWTRLYIGSEDDCFHALTMPGDGSLIRVRLTPAADGRKLYRQRVASPGPGSDFSGWTYTNQYGCLAVAAASCGAEVSIIWINENREVRRIISSDNGATWGTPELIDYSPTTSVNGLTASYKPNGDLGIFFADQTTLYVKKRVGGSWQEKTAWDKTTGDLSGVAAVYDADWNLIVSGQDSAGNFKLWSLIYGDGGDVASGTWSALKEFASAPSDGNFQYNGVFMAKPDVYRCFYIETFSGTEAYHRPFWSHSVPGSSFTDNPWREPVPCNLSSEYGLAIAHHGDYCWLSAPSGVWRAGLGETSLDLSLDVISLNQETEPGQGRLTIELRNDEGNYASLPAPLEIGCQIEFSPGYVTAEGNELSSGQTFALEACEYISSGTQAGLLLHARDGWDRINKWQARHQFRWNQGSEEMDVKQIIEFVLARVGLKLETLSQSSVITSYYPDFAIHTGNRGDTIIGKLLSFVPDVLFIEGNKACLVNPLSSDESVYAYGQAHALFESRYQYSAWKVNRIQVEGYDPTSAELLVVDSFSWGKIDKLYDRLKQLEDRNIDTVTKAEERGSAYLRHAEMESGRSNIRIPVNCGQQLYDVIDVTDSRAGLSAEKKRVLGMVLVHNPSRGEYEHRLLLGGV